MARPLKATVDYFPHSCTHGKTMFILEQKYGNNGYSFWFKLLEILGSTAGHYIDLNDDSAREFLQAKTQHSNSSCNEILDLLAKLDAIDSELWEHRVIWSSNFVNGIAQVYSNRRVEIPKRPNFYIQKPCQDDVSTEQNPQTILYYTKLNKTRNEKTLTKDTKCPKDGDGLPQNGVFHDTNPGESEDTNSGKSEDTNSGEPIPETTRDLPKTNLKYTYGEFQNVKLTDEEYLKLKDQFNNFAERIEDLSTYIASKGKGYKNHYAAILAWDRREKRRQEAERAKTRTHPRPGAPGYKYEDPD